MCVCVSWSLLVLHLENDPSVHLLPPPSASLSGASQASKEEQVTVISSINGDKEKGKR